MPKDTGMGSYLFLLQITPFMLPSDTEGSLISVGLLCCTHDDVQTLMTVKG